MKTQKFDEIAYLSIREHWARLILEGYRDVENRTKKWSHRGDLLIHSSTNFKGFDEVKKRAESDGDISVPQREGFLLEPLPGLLKWLTMLKNMIPIGLLEPSVMCSQTEGNCPDSFPRLLRVVKGL